MDGIGDEFLARAALAGDEDGGIGLGDKGDLLEHPLHRSRAPEECGGTPDGLAIDGLARGGRALQGPLDDMHRLIEIERFGQVVERPCCQRSHRDIETAKCRHDDDRRRVRREVANPPQGVHAVNPRQADIHQHHIGRPPLRTGNRRLPAVGHDDIVPLVREDLFETPADGRFVVDNEDVGHGE